MSVAPGKPEFNGLRHSPQACGHAKKAACAPFASVPCWI